jgi:hypothetical protein
MSKISFGFRAPHNFRQRESFPGGDRRTVPYENRIIYAENYESKKKKVRGMDASGKKIVNCSYDFSHRGRGISCSGKCARIGPRTTTVLSCEGRTSSGL